MLALSPGFFPNTNIPWGASIKLAYVSIRMEYKGEPLPEKIPWEGEFTLRSDP